VQVHEERNLDILQVTVNNVCNLACPHCYLNVAGTGVITPTVIEKVFEDPPAKVAIVGMEPLYNRESIEAVREIVRRSRETETFVSMITNGLGLKFLRGLPRKDLPDLIDVSLDGGQKYYERFRGNGKDLFPKIVANAETIRADHPDLPINLLHTLFTENTEPEMVADMITGSKMVSPTGSIFFSPYIPPQTEIGQRQARASRLSLEQMFEVLKKTPAFMDEPHARFFAGAYNAGSFGLSVDELLDLIASYGLAEKSRIDTGIPHLNRGLRVLYDGYALRPDYSIHTSLYAKGRAPIENQKLVDIYREFQSLPSALELLSRRS
jgi:hypothetical protein